MVTVESQTPGYVEYLKRQERHKQIEAENYYREYTNRKQIRANLDYDAKMHIQKIWDNCHWSKGKILSAIVRDYIRKNEYDFSSIQRIIREDLRSGRVVQTGNK